MIKKEENRIVKGSFVILNDKGLHTRPSTELVKLAATFRSLISLYYRDFCVNGKSLLGILMLAATKGSRIYIEAEGDDARLAINSIINLAQNKFNIKY